MIGRARPAQKLVIKLQGEFDDYGFMEARMTSTGALNVARRNKIERGGISELVVPTADMSPAAYKRSSYDRYMEDMVVVFLLGVRNLKTRNNERADEALEA